MCLFVYVCGIRWLLFWFWAWVGCCLVCFVSLDLGLLGALLVFSYIYLLVGLCLMSVEWFVLFGDFIWAFIKWMVDCLLLVLGWHLCLFWLLVSCLVLLNSGLWLFCGLLFGRLLGCFWVCLFFIYLNLFTLVNSLLLVLVVCDYCYVFVKFESFILLVLISCICFVYWFVVCLFVWFVRWLCICGETFTLFLWMVLGYGLLVLFACCVVFAGF